MRKKNELLDPKSCFCKADRDEMIFVLLGRDAAAPATIRFWAQERVRLGKNQIDDPQITEAMQAADIMDRERSK
jgi:hypothetical protein